MKIQLLLILLMITQIGCSWSEAEKSSIEKMKQELGELKGQSRELDEKIQNLEKAIENQDPDFSSDRSNATLVSAIPVEVRDFEHKIEVRGSVESRKNIMISSEVMGKIESVYAREGQKVKKGDLLMALNSQVTRNKIAELQTSLELAETIYRRRGNLWNRNIGSEIQYLEAKNNKESIERRLSTEYSELAKTRIKAPFNGVLDEIPVREGEMAQPGIPLVRVVSQDDMYIEADISERYIGRFEPGDSGEVYFPALDLRIISTISALGQVINRDNRTFSVEIKLPRMDIEFKPNLVAVVKLRDYHNPVAKVVPTNIIQQDGRGDFIYLVEAEEGNVKAKKNYIELGVSYNKNTEVVAGLTGTETVIFKGVREVSDGVRVQIAQEPSDNEFSDVSNTELENAGSE